MGSKAAVDFHHGSPNYMTVNEVVGSKLSEVAGRISVDQGQVYILNPQGIVYHDGATIEGSVIMGTNTLNKDAFYENGHVLLNATDTSGPVLINGNLTIKEAGLLGIVAPYFSNKGHITGELHVAAGKEVRVDFGDKRLSFTLNGQLKEAFLNTTKGSTIEGKAVTMTVGAVEQVLNETLRIDGTIRAKGLKEEGGRILLDGGSTGKAVVAGKLDASGKMDPNGEPDASPGGVISVIGHTTEAEPTAELDVSGTTGGEIFFGVNKNFRRSDTQSVLQNPNVKATNVNILSGAKMTANATTGKGGSVISIAKDMATFEGKENLSEPSIFVTSQKGSGGFVEVSGNRLQAGGVVDARSIETNEHGQILFDPGSITVTASGGDMTGAALSANLNSGNLTLQTTKDYTSGPDLITIDDAVNWSQNSLSLIGKDINFTENAQVAATGSALLKIRTAYSTSIPQGDITLASGSSITTSLPIRLFSIDGIPHITDNGATLSTSFTNYMNIYGATNNTPYNGLTYVAANLSGRYALANDINVGTFTPMGTFTGTLTGDALGVQGPGSNYVFTIPSGTYTLSGSTINFGIFSSLDGASIDSLGLNVTASLNIDFTSDYNPSYTANIGLLAATATNNSTLSNISITGNQTLIYTGAEYTSATALSLGGLVGQMNNSSLSDTQSSLGISLINPSFPGVAQGFILGGVVGQVLSNSSLSNVSTTSNAQVSSDLGNPGVNYFNLAQGGLVGSNSTGTIVNSSSAGPVNATGSFVFGEAPGVSFSIGGFVGQSTGISGTNTSSSAVTITNQNPGVTPTYKTSLYIGGFAGSMTGDLASAQSTGTISVTNQPANSTAEFHVGGLVGNTTGAVSNSFSTSAISYNEQGLSAYSLYLSGLVASTTGSSINNCYYNNSLLCSNQGTLPSVYMGGLVGFSSSLTGLTISNSYLGTAASVSYTSTESANGSIHMGGISGRNIEPLTLSQSYVLGNGSNSLVFSNQSGGAVLTHVLIGGLIGSAGSTLTLSNSYNQGNMGIFNTASSGEPPSINGNLKVGGVIGTTENGLSVTGSYNSGNLSLSNGLGTIGSSGGFVNIGGFIGNISTEPTIISSYNSGNLTFTNGTTNGNGSILSGISMGGFVGNSASTIDGTDNENTSSGTLTFTNGVSGGNTGTLGGTLSIGGFAGTMGGDLVAVQSSTNVEVINNSTLTPEGDTNIGGLVASTTGSILNSSASGDVSYTENATNSNPLCLGGLVAQISGGIIRSSSYNGALSALISASGTLGSSLYTGGLVAFSNSNPTIQDSFLGPSSSIAITNEGAISYGINMGGLSAYGTSSLSISNSYVSNDSTLTLINSGSVGASIFAGGLVGNSPETITLSTSTYNGGTLTITNTGTVSENLYYGGIIGFLSSTLIGTGASNTGTVTLYNGYTGGAGTIEGDLAMGGFVGNSTKAIDGTEGANTTSGTVIFTNGNGSNSGTLGGGVYIGGFAGSMGGTLTAAQSSANVTITDTNLETPEILFYVGGLVGITTADLLNSFSSGGVSYTENSVNSGGSLYIAGLVASTTGNIENSYYSGGLSTVVNNTLGFLYMGGLVASTSGGQISESSLWSSAGISVKNSGTTDYVAMGGLSAYNLEALSISDSHILNIDLNLENSGPLSTDIFWGGLVGTSAAAVALSECSNNGSLLITNTGNVGGYLNYGGVFGSAYGGSTSESSSNTGNLTLTNGSTNGSGTIVSGIAMGGFVGNSAGALNGTNSSSGTVAFTNGVSGGNSGTVENNFNVGGFAGIMGGDLTSAQSSTNVEVINNSLQAPLEGTNVAGLVASTTGSILNSSASGDVSYTENATNSNPLYLGGLVAQTTGTNITGSSYNGALSALISASGTLGSTLYTAGLVASPNSPLAISGSSLGASSSIEVTNAGTITGNAFLGGLIGNSSAVGSVSLSGPSYNYGDMVVTNEGAFSGTLSYGGIIGSVGTGSTSIGTLNTGNLTLRNGTSGGAGTITGNLSMGGFVGNSASTIDGTSGANTTSGTVAFTNGNGVTNSGTLGGILSIGGFAGTMGGDLIYARSSGNVTVIDQNAPNPTTAFYVAGLVASTAGAVSNSTASGNVSYTENSTTTNVLGLAGLVAQTTGASINSSSYNGAVQAVINSPANINGDLFLSGIVAVPNSALTISGTSLGTSSSVSATNSGAITNLLIGGLSAANQAALTISGSSVGKNASLGITNTSTGTITGYVALGGLVSDAAHAVTLSGSNNQGNLSFTNDGTFNTDFYYGGIMASPRQGSTIDQTFSSGTMEVTNSGTLSGDLYMGGFAGQGQSVGDFIATNTYTTGPLTLNNSSTLSGSVYMGGFIGSALNDSSISTSYSRSSVSLTNTDTITGTINSGSFAGSNGGTIGTSYVLQSALPIVGSGSSAGITSLQPIQMVEQKSFPSFNFGNIWTIQEFISTPYFINSSYIPYLPGFRPDSTYLQEIAKVIQTTLSILHDHRTLVAMEDPLKHVSVESPLQNEGFSLFGHEDVARSANEASLRTDEEESQGLFGTA